MLTRRRLGRVGADARPCATIAPAKGSSAPPKAAPLRSSSTDRPSVPAPPAPRRSTNPPSIQSPTRAPWSRPVRTFALLAHTRCRQVTAPAASQRTSRPFGSGRDAGQARTAGRDCRWRPGPTAGARQFRTCRRGAEPPTESRSRATDDWDRAKSSTPRGRSAAGPRRRQTPRRARSCPRQESRSEARCP